jgi:O6-methylguanine-DNA--protein-cysteine methyltransferase
MSVADLLKERFRKVLQVRDEEIERSNAILAEVRRIGSGRQSEYNQIQRKIDQCERELRDIYVILSRT